jgi:hypothetical protein
MVKLGRTIFCLHEVRPVVAVPLGRPATLLNYVAQTGRVAWGNLSHKDPPRKNGGRWAPSYFWPKIHISIVFLAKNTYFHRIKNSSDGEKPALTTRFAAEP